MGKINNIQQAEIAKNFAVNLVENMINQYGENAKLKDVLADLQKSNPETLIGQSY